MIQYNIFQTNISGC